MFQMWKSRSLQNAPNGKKRKNIIPLTAFEEEQGGQGLCLFYLASHQEPLINLEVGPKCELTTFLTDSAATHSCSLPSITYSSEELSISGIKDLKQIS